MTTASIDELLKNGNDAFAQGNYHQALNQYLKIIDIDPANQVGLAKVATAYYKLRDYPKAVAALNKALEGDPKNRDLLVMLGMVYVRTNDKTNALAVYDRLKKVHPDKAELLYKEIYK
ncbi:MAG: hypothetical protein OZSIB_3893 [Candidatus Ozemobacter sibiricus]|jgi:tetratricopeptide (TPR) repeat protein|uniref:Uncharacterized protein n=1 Tax=Candidatus Ozemobacter sibiricus TaxID=2268124 RepID=A0A367ZPF7_9BACT|nr:MAG: hypothetical protein OZSIB_3893 [Candidatus Ozemobacter sibiricus]